MIKRQYVDEDIAAYYADLKLNQIKEEDEPVHSWYRFVLSFPPHLVREYIKKFDLQTGQVVLDPFCGTGTTLVESKKLGLESVGIDAHPMCFFASKTKVNWREDSVGLKRHALQIAHMAEARLSQISMNDLRTLPEDEMKLLIKGSISPIPLHKTLILRDCIYSCYDARYADYELLALARILVTTTGNLRFGPEVGVTKPKLDAPVIEDWLDSVNKIAEDLDVVRERHNVPATVFLSDSREVTRILSPKSIDAVITSPPYPNEKDYTRTTRLESVLLGFIRSKEDLQRHKRSLLRSNSRNVYAGDDDSQWVANNKQIEHLITAIENRRQELGKTSGFEKLYSKVVSLYFGGMARHLAELRSVLRPGAHLAYVVGEQASFFRILIRTGELLAGIASELGYEIIGLDLFRTRFSTATKKALREEVLVLRWPG